jgi:hypothetical protein
MAGSQDNADDLIDGGRPFLSDIFHQFAVFLWRVRVLKSTA